MAQKLCKVQSVKWKVLKLTSFSVVIQHIYTLIS